MYEAIDPRFNPQIPLNPQQQINFVESWLKDTCSVTEDKIDRDRFIPPSTYILGKWIKGDPFPFENPVTANEKRFKAALLLITTTTTGRTLLHTIRCCKSHPSATDAGGIRIWNPLTKILLHIKTSDEGPSAKGRREKVHGSNGIGMNTNLYFNLDDSQYVDYYREDNMGMTIAQFDCIALFHELVHIYHILIGEFTSVMYYGFIPDHPMRYCSIYEEARTVGLGNFKNEGLSENKFREELGVPRRELYGTSGCYINDNNEIHSLLDGPLKVYKLETKLIRPYK